MSKLNDIRKTNRGELLRTLGSVDQEFLYFAEVGQGPVAVNILRHRHIREAGERLNYAEIALDSLINKWDELRNDHTVSDYDKYLKFNQLMRDIKEGK